MHGRLRATLSRALNMTRSSVVHGVGIDLRGDKYVDAETLKLNNFTFFSFFMCLPTRPLTEVSEDITIMNGESCK